jgi:hypothetical protein
LAIVLGLFVFRTGALDLASCASALAPIFSGAQGHQCVQLTITTASASSPTVRLPHSLASDLARMPLAIGERR